MLSCFQILEICKVAVENVYQKYWLTNDIECDEVAHFRFGADLTLVLTAISRLNIFYLEGPRVSRFDEKSLKPVVRYERVSVHSQNMGVSSSNPRDLDINEKREIITNVRSDQVTLWSNDRVTISE